MGIDCGNFQESLGDSAGAAGVLFPCGPHTNELGKSGRADAHVASDGRRVGIYFNVHMDPDDMLLETLRTVTKARFLIISMLMSQIKIDA